MEFSIPHSSPCLTEKDFGAIASVLETRMLAEGPLVKEFEQAIAQYLGFDWSTVTTSGTTALFLAMLGLDIGNNDEVILPTYVCKAVYDAVRSVGAIPVLCDIEEDWCSNVNTIRPLVTTQTKAIILVHIFGIQIETQEIYDIGVPVIEDYCQAFSPDHIRKDYLTSSVSVLSFHATKLLTTGRGGMLLCNDIGVIERIEAYKDSDNISGPGMIASPFTELQAALGLSQLSQYHIFLQKRLEIAGRYLHELQDCPVILPFNIRDRSIFFRFPVRVRGSFELMQERFEKHNIIIRRGVDQLLHNLLGIDPSQYPTAERMFRETVSIPIYPALTDEQVDTIIAACKICME